MGTMNASMPTAWGRVREAEAMTRLNERLRGQFPEVPAAAIEDAVHGRYHDAITASRADTQPAARHLEHSPNRADLGHDRGRRA